MIDLFGLQAEAKRKQLWASPYHARRVALERCIARQGKESWRTEAMERALASIGHKQGILETLLTAGKAND